MAEWLIASVCLRPALCPPRLLSPPVHAQCLHLAPALGPTWRDANQAREYGRLGCDSAVLIVNSYPIT
jgi:hypothetical protein